MFTFKRSGILLLLPEDFLSLFCISTALLMSLSSAGDREFSLMVVVVSAEPGLLLALEGVSSVFFRGKGTEGSPVDKEAGPEGPTDAGGVRPAGRVYEHWYVDLPPRVRSSLIAVINNNNLTLLAKIVNDGYTFKFHASFETFLESASRTLFPGGDSNWAVGSPQADVVLLVLDSPLEESFA